jgi:hydrogenase maturation protease
VIGVGNRLRRDDAAGLHAVDRLRERAQAAGIAVRVQEGEALGLLEQWEGARTVVLIDAIHADSPPGEIHRVDLSSEPVPARLGGSSSTHAVGMADAIELARALGCLPAGVILYGVQGRRFDSGGGLSREVEGAIAQLAEAALAEARRADAQALSRAAATAAWP